MIMKRNIKPLLALTVFLSATALQAQNVQLHYDFGRNIYPDEEAGRQKVTMTLEHFNADKHGSWFYFVDLDLSRKYAEAFYTEISREINLGKNTPFAIHVEYNGGTSRNSSFQHAGLAGAAWNGHTADFSKTWGVQLMYKHYFKSYDYTSAYASAQLTGIWGMNFAANAIRFSGFIDFWRGQKANGHGQLVMLTEPQLWYNLNTIESLKDVNLSVGTEVEISNNFIFNTYNDKAFFVNPTLALKWTF